MKGKYVNHWWSLLLQISFMMASSNATQCTRIPGRSVTMLGVFDSDDTASIHKFQSTVEELDRLVAKEHGCLPKVTHKELILHDQMSAREVINATRNVFLMEKICYVVYSSNSSSGRLVLDYSINSGITVVSTIPNKVYNSKDEQWGYTYDPAKVISLNKRSSLSTKVQVILKFLLKENHKEFVAITGVDFDDMSMVSSLRQDIHQHNLVMVDWFIIPKDNNIFNRTREKISSLESSVTILLIITDDLHFANKIVTAITSPTPGKDLGPQMLLVADLDSETINHMNFPVDMYIIFPRINQTFSSSDYVEAAIQRDWILNRTGQCPSIKDNQRQLPSNGYHIAFKTTGQKPQTIEEGYLSEDGILYTTEISKRPKIQLAIIEYAPYIMKQHKITPTESCTSNALPCHEIVKGPHGTNQTQEICCTGFVIGVIKLLRDELRFDPYLEFNYDGIAGTQETNGSWKGIVNDLVLEKAHTSPDLFPNSRRSEVLDFTNPYMPTGISLLVKELKRQQSKIYWTSYMRPFTATLWYVFVGSIGVMVAFLWFVEKLGPSGMDRKLFHWQTAFCIDNAVCYVLQLAFGRPADEKKPMSNGARLAGLMFGIAMVTLMASYSANLAAFLIVSDMTTPVESIYDEEIKNPPPGFKYGTLDGSYMADFFKNHGIKDFRDIWEIMKNDNVKSLTEGVQKVLSGELDVFIGDTVSLTYATLSDSSCQLKVVGEPFAMSGASFAFKKGSRYLAPFSTALRGLKSKGLTDFIDKFWVKKFTCNKVTPPAQLHLEDLSGLFLQLLIFIMLCIFWSILHFIWTQVHTDYRQCEHENEPVEL